MKTLRKLVTGLFLLGLVLPALTSVSVVYGQQDDQYIRYEDEYDPSLNPGGEEEEEGKDHYYKNRPGYEQYYKK